MLVCVSLHNFAHETAGAARTRSSLHPRCFEGHETSHQLGARAACECSGVFGRFLHLAPLAAIECTHLLVIGQHPQKTRVFSTIADRPASSVSETGGHLSP